jgi:hypothetical protein
MRRFLFFLVCVLVVVAGEEDESFLLPVEDDPVGLNAPVYNSKPQVAVMPPSLPYLGGTYDESVPRPPAPTIEAGEDAPTPSSSYIL